MKKISFIMLIFIFASCIKKKESFSQNQSENITAVCNKENLELNKNETLKKWIDYYKININSDFKLDKFKFISENSLGKTTGTIYGIYDKEFDKIYSDFLIYNSTKQQYIDIDSYQWSLNDKKEPQFEIDQEINLVDIPNKKIKKIGFRSSSNWVEDAYWKNDYTIISLENCSEMTPIITQINLNTGKVLTFKYKDTLNKKSEYSTYRIHSKLNN